MQLIATDFLINLLMNFSNPVALVNLFLLQRYFVRKLRVLEVLFENKR